MDRSAISPTPLATFVVRFWRETPAGGARWRGQIEHVQSGEKAAFLDIETMQRFLRRFGVEVDVTCRPAPAQG